MDHSSKRHDLARRTVLMSLASAAAAPVAWAQPSAGVDRFAGVYQAPDETTVGIDLFVGDDGAPGLLYSDYRTGEVRRLFPQAAGGFGVGPGFGVAAPVELTVRFQQAPDGDVASMTLQPAQGPQIMARKVGPTASDVSFKSRDATLAGTLLTPPGAGPHPAIVLLHGSGPLGRWSFGPYPHFFNSLGLAVLVYDKRSAGASTGVYMPRDEIYPQSFLRDAVAAVGFLGTHPGIDPRRIGLWGASEGGMLSTQAAAQRPDLAFAINSSGFMVPLWRQVEYNIGAQLRADGSSTGDVADAVAFQKLQIETMRGGGDWERYQAARAIARKTSWWMAFFGSYQGFPTAAALQWRWDHVYSFDPLPALRSVRCPVLGVFGELDTSTPAHDAARNMQRELSAAGNRDVTVRILPNANHALMAAHTGGGAEIPSLKGQAPICSQR